MSQENIDVIRQGSRHGTLGDRDGVREVFDPGIIWQGPEGGRGRTRVGRRSCATVLHRLASMARKKEPPEKKSVFVAFVLGLVFLGCFYTNHYGSGVLFILLFLLGLVTFPIGLGVLIVLGAWFGSVAVSVSSARATREA